MVKLRRDKSHHNQWFCGKIYPNKVEILSNWTSLVVYLRPQELNWQVIRTWEAGT